MKDVCLITYDKLILINETNPSSSSTTLLNPYIHNVTEPLLFNLKLLFNTIDDLTFDLNLLRIILCFHHELSALIFLLLFSLQNIWICACELYKKKFGIILSLKNCNKDNSDIEKQEQTPCIKSPFQTRSDSSEFLFKSSLSPETEQNIIFKNTACFKIKKIVAAILVLIYLIELSIILLLYEYNIFGQGFQYFCFNIFNFISTLCVLYYMFSKNNNYKHQKFICSYWLILLCNFLWSISSYYVSIVDGDGTTSSSSSSVSLWKICSTCYWKSSAYPNNDHHFSYWNFPMTTQQNFRQIITFHEQDETDLLNRTSLIWFHFNCFFSLLFFCQFLLSFFPDLKPDLYRSVIVTNSDNDKDGHEFNPEQISTPFGKAFFIWISSTIYCGYRRPLAIGDLFKTTYLSVERMEKYFSQKFFFGYPPDPSDSFKSKYRTSIRLMKIFLQQFGWEFVGISFIKLIPTLITFIGPLLLDRLIKFTTSVNYEQPKWHGYAYVLAMFILFLNESILNSYSDYRLMVLALKIRATLTATIYRRLLQNGIDYSIMSDKSSEKDGQKYTSGQIVNIMSTDTQRVFEYIKCVNLFWICPLQITIATILLWQHLGYGSLAGLAVLLLLLPFNAFIGAKIRSLQSKLLKHKDCRIKFLNETLASIRAIKLYAWEQFFHNRIEKPRRKEISNLRIQALYSAAITFAFTSAPFFVAFASFSLFIYINNFDNKSGVHLDANKAFVSLAIFNIIRRPLAFFPQLITNSMMFLVSLKRISDFLKPNPAQSNQLKQLKTLDVEHFYKHSGDSKPQIRIENCDFYWSNSQKFLLTQIDLNINQPQLLAIVGGIGSGKSSLLSALLGQMKIQQKKEFAVFNVRGKIAYVPQNSWIQSGTIRENILFGKPLDTVRYWKIIDACALLDDIKQMTDGDKTLVGEKGYNLSGGQRQRISLARAIYSEADLYLLDDPLSAVDSQVSKHIFNRVIGSKGLLCNKIRLLVTHNMALLPNVDQIILLDNGRQSVQGSYNELIEKENEFTEFLTTYFSTNTNTNNIKQIDTLSTETDDDDTATLLLVDEEEDYEILVDMANRLERQFSSFSRRGSVLRKISISKDSVKKKKKNFKMKSDKSKISKEAIQSDFSETTIRSGSISYKIYWNYIRAIGIVPLVSILTCYSFGHCFVVLTNLWLSSWSNDRISQEDHSQQDKIHYKLVVLLMKLGLINHSSNSQFINQWTRLNIYAILGLGQTIFILLATLLLNFACLRGSQQLHRSMLARMMHAPVWFFDQATSGQILNRFNKDIDLADTSLISTLRLFMIEVFRSIALFAIIGLGTNSPIILGFFIPLVIGYFLIYKYYVSTSRQLMRLESSLRTPIYLQFMETYSGVAVIQAFEVMEMFLKKIYCHIDKNTSAIHMSIAASRWLSVRLECLGNLVVLITALACVMLRGQITPGMVGLCITCSLTITGTLNLLIRSSIELETNIVAVERLIEYTRLPQEDEWYKNSEIIKLNQNENRKKISQQQNRSNQLSKTVAYDDNNLTGVLCPTTSDTNWLKDGSISFCQYSARYQNNLALCLKNITLNISAGTKVGIVGRTGAGKSSFGMALFRLIEPETGYILMGEQQNIKEIGLHELRCALTIIPQDPLLFTGTLRDNLDPFHQYSDQQILEALTKAHLGDIACSIKGLYQSMDIWMNRLSFGQKQLFCLARSLLRKSKILILDEATAGMDPATDLLVQQTIRLEFAECTVLTIAHRLKTIMDYDRILVLEHGQVMEYDSPKTLISNTNSLFYKMISQ